jgi:hypothetical protein
VRTSVSEVNGVALPVQAGGPQDFALTHHDSELLYENLRW